jgi:hypothetical protein
MYSKILIKDPLPHQVYWRNDEISNDINPARCPTGALPPLIREDALPLAGGRRGRSRKLKTQRSRGRKAHRRNRTRHHKRC